VLCKCRARATTVVRCCDAAHRGSTPVARAASARGRVFFSIAVRRAREAPPRASGAFKNPHPYAWNHAQYALARTRAIDIKPPARERTTARDRASTTHKYTHIDVRRVLYVFCRLERQASRVFFVCGRGWGVGANVARAGVARCAFKGDFTR